MSWSKSTTAKHTCGGPVFGQKTPGCPRCDELLAGAEPVQWNMRRGRKCSTPGCGRMTEPGEYTNLCRSCQVKAHDCLASRCGAVCTAFDW